MKCWYQTNWEKEDQLYKPKRKVNNQNSHAHPHIIGSFYSQRMGRPVHYESLGERLFYYYLELDRDVVRYYEQPVEIAITSADGKTWMHVPDVLFFKRGAPPLLCQVKESEEEATHDLKLKLINRHCEEYAAEQGWSYKVIYPKELPDVLARNLKYLKRFLRPRKYYQDWVDRVVQRVIYLESCSVRSLAETFDDKIDPLALIPLVYYLVAKGVLNVDFNQVINSNTLVTFNREMYTLPATF